MRAKKSKEEAKGTTTQTISNTSIEAVEDNTNRQIGKKEIERTKLNKRPKKGDKLAKKSQKSKKEDEDANTSKQSKNEVEDAKKSLVSKEGQLVQTKHNMSTREKVNAAFTHVYFM